MSHLLHLKRNVKASASLMWSDTVTNIFTNDNTNFKWKPCRHWPLRWRWWARWSLKSPAFRLFAEPFVQAQIKKIKAPHHWLCAGNSPETDEFPAQRASNAENVSILWRHHVKDVSCDGQTLQIIAHTIRAVYVRLWFNKSSNYHIMYFHGPLFSYASRWYCLL